jgi:hypothetical protein
MQELTTRPKKLNAKQKLTLELWLTPNQPCFGNLYKSCINAGFKPSYALNIAHLRPKWLSETIELIELDAGHIKAGITEIATNKRVDSRSPADTNLKALELLANIAGIVGNKGTTVNIVQPILSGLSNTPVKVDNEVVDTVDGD